MVQLGTPFRRDMWLAYVSRGKRRAVVVLDGNNNPKRVFFMCHAHVLAGGGDAFEKLEVVVGLHAPLLDPLAQHVERCQVARVGRIQDRHHHLAKQAAIEQKEG